MSDGFLERFPDPGPILRLQGDAEVGVKGLLDVVGSLGHDRDGSPLAGIAGAVGKLDAVLDIDVGGLSTRLPAALDVLRNALPSSALEYVEDIEQAYAAAQDFLATNPLVTSIGQGSNLQDTALAVIGDALTQFESSLTDLAEDLIDPDTLDLVRSGLADIDRFRTDFPGNRDRFLPFLAENLLGVAPDILRAPLDHLEASLAVLAPLEPPALDPALDPARQVMAAAAAGLVAAVDSLDPGQAAGYAAIQARLGDLEAAIRSTDAALAGIYQTLGSLVDGHDWDGVLSTYRTLLDAVDVGQVVTVDEVVGAITGILDELLGRLLAVLDADELGAQVGLLVQTLDDSVATSGLGHARDAVRDFLDEIRQAIQQVPTEEIGKAVEAMLDRVKLELDDLGISTVGDTIEAAFTRVDTVVAQTFTPALADDVAAALDRVLTKVADLPIGNLAGQLGATLQQLGDLIDEIAAALQAPMDEVASFAAQLDELSFRPLGDEVIEEITEVRSQLEEIDANALSEVERLALTAALAVLRSVDLEGQVIGGLKQGFAAAQRQVTDVLAELGRILDRVRAHVDQFSPDKALRPLDGLLGQAGAQLERVNGSLLLRPLYTQVDDLAGRLAAYSPGTLLDPLQDPYDALITAVNRIDPAQWVAPLRLLYAEIDRLIGLVDVTPLFEELDRRRRQLLADVRSALLDGLTGLDLPEPLKGLLDGLRPFLEGVTDALFSGGIATEVPRLSTELQAGFDLQAPLKVLDAPFDQLLQMLATVPRDALTETVNTVRSSVGVGLDALDPRAIVARFRQAQGILAGLAPPAMLAIPLGLPALRAAFEATVQAAPPERADDVAAVRVSFDATFTLVDPDPLEGAMRRLARTHAEVAARLGQRIARLDVTAVGDAYARVRNDLDRLVPDFLRGQEPLTYEQVMAGLAGMRPSARAAPVEAAVRRFLVHAQPLQEAIGEAVDSVFGALGRLLALVDPVSLKDAVAAIYQTVRDKARIIDPDALAQSLRDKLLAPLLAPLRAIDPSAIKQRLDQSFTRAVAAIRTSVTAILDAVAGVVDEKLRAVRAKVGQVITDLRQTLQRVGKDLQAVVERVERLVLVELLERLNRLVANLGTSFDQELDRVRAAFDDMLDAIPLDGGGVHAANAAGT
jgi:methyl-accepting chemotaxis protein